MLLRTAPTRPRTPRASAILDGLGAGPQWSPALRRLRRDLAVITAASTALLWVDNLSEHYRGGFRRKLMYVTIVANPLVAAAGAVTAATGGRRGRSGRQVMQVHHLTSGRGAPAARGRARALIRRT